jgi:hypothetical protein
MIPSSDLLLAGALLLATPIAIACGTTSGSPRLVVSSSPLLRGEPVTLRADHLAPGSTVRLEAAGKDQFGQAWRSQADFRADALGAIDVARDAPVSGSYSGVSREGPFWSMALDPAADVITPMVSIDDVELTLRDPGGAVLTRGAVTFTNSLGVTEVPVSTAIQGSLFAPVGASGRRPALPLPGRHPGRDAFRLP